VSETRKPDDLPELPPGPPVLFVLSGFSGAGKDSIRDLLIAWKRPLHFTVTATTRPKRPHEQEGRDYHFVSDAEFDRLEREDALIERAIVYGQRKGVPRDEVIKPLEAGRDVLARVDVQGAFTLRELIPDAVLIFIAPPSLEEGVRRLESRDTEPDDEKRLRVQTAAEELEASKRFDYVVVNETGAVEGAALRVVQIMADEKRKRATAGKR
jgi:guanylate kinase